jgi:DNA-binding NtrC family response regulator
VEQHRILIIDDEQDLCWVLANSLRRSGYYVSMAHTGADALKLLEANDYAVAFIDAKLPDLDGLALADYIFRKGWPTSVIMISGYFYQEDQLIADGLQADHFFGFIAKPFDISQVRSLAQQAIERSMEAKDGKH